MKEVKKDSINSEEDREKRKKIIEARKEITEDRMLELKKERMG
jgi:hypothetical protein